jgi:HD-GYP domain-containing protein (c-di-GMP phosphodiesterase class II)
MPQRVKAFVYLILASSIATTVAMYWFEPATPVAWLSAACSMAALGVLAQKLAHSIGGGSAKGSMVLIPYLAAAILAPGWITVLAIAAAESLGQSSKKQAPIKYAFNVAQHSLGVAAAICAYRILGGQSLLEGPLQLGAYVALIAAFFATNTLAVSTAVALSENKPILQVWRQLTGTAILYDILAGPLPWTFAAVYVSKGALGAMALALPLLAVRQVFNTTRQLEQTTHELLELMVKAIEARDPYTSGHSQRVARYSRIIGRVVGLSTRSCERLATAALLHDVGKIHEIFAPLLRKPEKLTPEEWALMKTHSIKSAELVQTVSQLRDLVSPVRHHHENWDGTGYPDGLAGDQIPLWARVIALADTIDAMTTDRPYRKALGQAEVRNEMVAMAGRQFDPAICAALLSSPAFNSLFAASPVSGVQTRTPRSQPAIALVRNVG